MISRGMLLGILIAASALGVGAVIVRTEFAHQPSPTISTNPTAGTPSSRWLNQQRQAEHRSEQQGIEAACAALRKMGKTDKDCPPQ